MKVYEQYLFLGGGICNANKHVLLQDGNTGEGYLIFTLISKCKNYPICNLKKLFL